MNRILLLLYAFVCAFMVEANAQTTPKTQPDPDYFYSEDILLDNTPLSVSCKEIVIQGIKKFKFDVTIGNKTQSFEMTEINPNVKNIAIFQANVEIALDSLFKEDSCSRPDTDKDTYKTNTSQLLFQTYLKTIKTDQKDIKVGTLYANSKIKAFSKRNKSDEPPLSLAINKAVIEFEEEQIFSIKVSSTPVDTVRDGSEGILFQNRIPIAYSTKSDVSRDRLKRDAKLFDTTNSRYINLSDVFYNDYELVNNTENYSPKDQVITLKPSGGGTIIMKEKVKNILSAQVYSDLLGFNNPNPNGLIQTEVSQRVFLNRKVHNIPGMPFSYIGLFNSIMPKIIVSKLEDNNKYLVPEVDNNNLYVNAIDLLKHSAWSSGGEVNFFYVGIPKIHSTFYVNGGAYIKNVPMQLSSLEGLNLEKQKNLNINETDLTFNMNIIAVYPEVNWTISPHSNFQIANNIKLFRLFDFTEDVTMLNGPYMPSNEYSEDKEPWIISLKFLASVKLNNTPDGKIFFRSIYNFISNKASNNYLQLQLGYSFNIFDKQP